MSEALLVHSDSEHDPDMLALTGVAIGDPFTYIELPDRRIVAISLLDAATIEREAGVDEIWLDDELGRGEMVRSGMPSQEVRMELVRRAVERAGLSSVTVPPAFPVALADYLRGKGVELTPEAKPFQMRRRVKGERALAGIRAAQRATEQGFEAARSAIGASSPGPDGLVLEGELLTVERLADIISTTLRDAGCGGEPPLISAGGRGLIGHDSATGALMPGESIIIDVFPQHLASRMHTDMTRTFCFGQAPERLHSMYGVIREALRRSSDQITAGVTGRHVWESACDVIEDAGYRTLRSIDDGESLAEDFFHSLGHGVGLSVHEAPLLGMSGADELVPGDVLAVEPGVYKAGFGGVRLEDMVVVREDGAELLTDFPYQLEIHG